MESNTARTGIYALVVLAVAALFGVSVMKLNHASQPAAEAPQQTQAQRLKALENSSALQSPQARNFVRNEAERQDATHEAEKAVAEGQ